MELEWDSDKNARNIRDRGLDFESVYGFEWATALVLEDMRRDYGEKRFRAMGFISGKLHILVVTPRHGMTRMTRMTRVISLRRANRREEIIYEKTHQT